MDEFASYFRGETKPKVMITTQKEPGATRVTYDFSAPGVPGGSDVLFSGETRGAAWEDASSVK